MNNTTEKIKDKLNIVDVISSYIKLEKSGSNFKACCPFHNEKTPSFFVSPDRGSFKCFGCGEGGDIFTFVEKYEGVDFIGALKILAEQAGVELKKENPKEFEQKSRIYLILEKSTQFFQNNLKNNKEALAYLEKRGIEKQTIEQFRLGFAPDAWSDLLEYLKTLDFSEDEIEKAGLIKKKEKGNSFYDRFRSRIIFPLFDNSDRPVAFSGRFFAEKEGETSTEQGQAKYLNSPETQLFYKSKILYGYNFAKKHARKLDFFIVVEGQMDLLMAHQSGYGNTVASSGTAFTEEQINLLKRFSEKLVIAFDGDDAGFNSATKIAKMALLNDIEVRLMNIPDDKDPADLLLEDKGKWKKLLREAKHIIDFYLERLIVEAKDKRILGKKVQQKVLPFVKLIQNEIEKANFVKTIANKLDVPEQVIWAELRKIKVDLPENLKYEADELISERLIKKDFSSDLKKKKSNILRQLTALYWLQKEKKMSLIKDEELREDLKKILKEDVFEKILNLPEKIKNDLILETEVFYEERDEEDDFESDLKNKIDDLLKNLKNFSYEEKANLILEEIKDLQFKEKNDLLMKKMKEYNDLLRKKDKLC